MKKFALCLSLVALVMALAVSAFAAETVIYENDFSNPATIGDFEQYRMEWEIKDGGLYLTEDFIPGTNGSLDTTFSHIIYRADQKLTDYIVEVDYMNIQTAGGIIFRADEDKVDSQDSGFQGYVAFIANDANKGALGSGGYDGIYKGNIKVGAGGNCNISNNVHIKVTVKGDKIHVLMTNIDNEKVVMDYTYTIGSDTVNDAVRADGTFGLRMRAGYKKNNAYSAGVAYFDNLKVTTANEVDLGGSGAVVAPPTTTGKLAIDTSNLVEVYKNTFDTFTSINDFEQFRGSWAVFDGRLYLSAASGGQSYILYCGDEDLVNLKDYVVDVDMYNIQTQGGVIARSDFMNVTGATDDGFMGYQAFVSNTGKQGALGAGQADGKWLEGNIEVSPICMTPGMNVHLQFAVKDNMLQFVITNIDTGDVIWQWAEAHDMWSQGTFGFRLRGNVSNNMSNLNTVSFDNLVVSVFGEEKPAPTEPEVTEPEVTEPEIPVVEPTVVKMTIGDTVGYINGEAKELDAAPIIRESRTMLPVRFVAEAFGAEVGWDGATSSAVIKTADVEIKIKIGSNTAIVNGVEVTLDSPAFIENSRTYMPVRFVAENLGASVAWDGVTSTATLTK